jgi:hypothetical protein
MFAYRPASTVVGLYVPLPRSKSEFTTLRSMIFAKRRSPTRRTSFFEHSPEYGLRGLLPG